MAMTKEEKIAVSDVVVALMDVSQFLVKLKADLESKGVEMLEPSVQMCISVEMATDAVVFLSKIMLPSAEKTKVPAATPDRKAN